MAKKVVLLLILFKIFLNNCYASELFNIDHEANDFSQYTQTFTDGGNLSTGSSAALNGSNYGLSVLINDANQVTGDKVITVAPQLRYRFYFDPNSITMANADKFTINYTKQNGGTYNTVVKISLNYLTATGYKIIAEPYDDSGWVGEFSQNISDGPHYVEVYINRATSDVSADGTCEFWVDGNSIGLQTSIDNYNIMFDQNWRQEYGMRDGRDAGTSGTIFVDDITANNDGGEIGPVVLNQGGMPGSTSYRLQSFSFGSGGGGLMGSSNFGLFGNMGEFSANLIGSSNFDLGAGLAFMRQSFVPNKPTLVNDGDYYDMLHLTLDNSIVVPDDTKYAVAISADNWATTKYVKSDMTVGGTLSMSDYMTYPLWGGSSGSVIVGLNVGTSYAVKVKSMQGQYSESGYSEQASAGTIFSASLTFDIDVSATDVSTNPPYQINFGDLYPGTVTTSSDKIWVSFETNAASGGSVFVYGQNGGLRSVSVGYTIPAISGNLAVAQNGFGAQGVGVTQTSGGPLTFDSLYGNGGDVVGTTDTLVRQLLVSTNPLTLGRASFLVKAKSSNDVPTASDYTETITIVAAANY